MNEERMTKAAYVMIGGFLGAGKTTAILRLAEYLKERDRSVGLITNDQSFGLVDTAMLSSHAFPTEEITGGCFCCRFNSLVEACEQLSAETRPDVFIAEPVGSCTDLKAAVSYPLRRIYGDNFRVAPLSVMVDPVRALRVLGIEPGKAFSSRVLYVYEKQLEEAEIIAINKADLLPLERLEKLQQGLRRSFPQAEQFVVSAREGDGLEKWFEHILTVDLGFAPAPEVDYELYAQGEALLGWLNATLQVDAAAPFDGNALLQDLAARIHRGLDEIEIAHLKMTLLPDEEMGDIGVLNLVRNDGTPELSHLLQAPLPSGELIINLRAEGDPEILRSIALTACRECADAHGVEVTVVHAESFRPAKPEPTHRMATA
jgi:Ni2+-binding GTPase involved in maturation of urease and hydrogenase